MSDAPSEPLPAPPPRRGVLRTIFVNAADGRLRSGWAIAIFLAIVAFGDGGAHGLLTLLKLGPDGGRLDDPRLILVSVISLSVTVFATFIASLAVSQPLTAAGLADARPLRHAAVGALLGVGAVSAASLLPALAGAESLTPGGGPGTLRMGLLNLAFMAPAAAFEELGFRGFTLQQLRRGTNTPAAVLISAACFGLAHLGNQHVGALATVNIALVGIWFALIVVRSGSIWMSTGAHFAWNYFEGYVWGQPVSGLQANHALIQRASCASDFWCGGAFGPEASGLTTVVLAALIALMLLSRRQRRAAAATIVS